MPTETSIIVGTAGWSMVRDLADRFPAAGSGLERYAAVFAGVEINSSAYRRHRPSTWQRWHDAVPAGFRFSVKLPQAITHQRKLVDAVGELELFLGDIAPLAAKLGPLLVQLPPSLAFEPGRDAAFFAQLRQRHAGRIVIEPRHASWGSGEASAVLADFAIDRVYADPQLDELRDAIDSGASPYLRLHGAPRVYYSAYPPDQLRAFERILTGARAGAWCIFDNTASGAALGNALDLHNSLLSGTNDEGSDLRLAL